MSIEATALVASIDPEALPDFGAGIMLPGAIESRDPAKPNTVSPKQQATIARHVKENFSATTTWAEAIAQLRARFLKGRQLDFGIVDGIISEGRFANRHDDLTTAQQDLVEVNLRALNGTQAHWDEGIAARIIQSSKQAREALSERFLRVDTQGQLQVAMDRFAALFGRPAVAAGTGEAMAGDPALQVTDGPDAAY
jgi:hypothetical protein